MKRIIIMVLVLFTGLSAVMAQTPEVYVTGGQNHVQGIAYDSAMDRMYLSFTTSFLVTDMQGNVIASIDRIQGHLGAMTFNQADRKVYASLECKDDVIGQGLSDFAKGRSMFYIAIIDVDKVTEKGMDSEDNEAIRIVCVKEATRDYHVTGFGVDGREYEHLYGCSGIDGVTIAPKLGKKGGKEYLYVAYGIYGDVLRDDNDYQVLLRYDMKELNKYAGTVKFGGFYDKGPKKPLDKTFIFTGNTNWGVQNLAYDKASGKMIMAVYKGKKERFANYPMYMFDISRKPAKRQLEGVGYDASKHPVIGSSSEPVQGVGFKYGATGMCPLGNGLFYFSENGKDSETGLQYSRVRLYRWTGDPVNPFEKY
ncbi:MAG: hypothetical protein K6B16_00935 [Bacteroidales bacterium]|nr:hypothetical protein [Bacteroidales bacterium]